LLAVALLLGLALVLSALRSYRDAGIAAEAITVRQAQAIERRLRRELSDRPPGTGELAARWKRMRRSGSST
jgi:hypothetical protein